ncbi:hypothetical protein LSAT2_016607 [Lamellibrachia satsuma]|nr:hypothetical protein LSAT2_016607 [Lamellibrachia satsuma]
MKAIRSALVQHRHDAYAKPRMKRYADKHANASPANPQQGDVVLVQQQKVNKLSTPFSPEPAVVSETKGSMITAKRASAGDSAADEPLSGGGMTVQLEDADLWRLFCSAGTEMIVNRAGRRMFPSVSVNIRGMQATATYRVALEIIPVDDQRYRFNNSWMAMGRTDPAVGNKVCEHPDSPNTGDKWMAQNVSFSMVKLSNHSDKATDNVVLKSRQKYMAQIVITRREGDFEDWRHFRFSLRLTTFMAVTAYQCEKIRHLKTYFMNPYINVFRDIKTATSWPDVATAVVLKNDHRHVTDNASSAPLPRVCYRVDKSVPSGHVQRRQLMYRVANSNAMMAAFNERLQCQALQQQQQQHYQQQIQQQQLLHQQQRQQLHQQQQMQQQQQQLRMQVHKHEKQKLRDQLQEQQQRRQQQQQRRQRQQQRRQRQQHLLSYTIESQQVAHYRSPWGVQFQRMSYAQKVRAPSAPPTDYLYHDYPCSRCGRPVHPRRTTCTTTTLAAGAGAQCTPDGLPVPRLPLQQVRAPSAPPTDYLYHDYPCSSSDSSNNISCNNCSSHTTCITSSNSNNSRCSNCSRHAICTITSSNDGSEDGRSDSGRPRGFVNDRTTGAQTMQQTTEEGNRVSTMTLSLSTWNDGFAMAAFSTSGRCPNEMSTTTSDSAERDIASWSDSATRIHAAKRITERTTDWVRLAHESDHTHVTKERLPRDAQEKRLPRENI